jgi:hypothetical protein
MPKRWITADELAVAAVRMTTYVQTYRVDPFNPNKLYWRGHFRLIYRMHPTRESQLVVKELKRWRFRLRMLNRSKDASWALPRAKDRYAVPPAKPFPVVATVFRILSLPFFGVGAVVIAPFLGLQWLADQFDPEEKKR